VIAKNEELFEARRKSAEDIQTITKASEGNRRARKAGLEAAELKIHQMDTDITDTFQAHRDEIERLTKDNRWLQKEVNLVSDALTGRHPDIEGLRNIVAEIDAMRYGMTKLREEKTILEEKIENTLEAMQQDRDHWKVAHDAET
jgi:archaellum component FlaC